MELGKFSRYLKYLLFLFGTLFICNSGSVEGSISKQFNSGKKITGTDFDKVFFQYSISFENYDSYSNQFDNFFGMNYLETESKRNFQDLSLSVDSQKIRDLYKDMLNNLTIIKKLKIDKEPFYKKKI